MKALKLTVVSWLLVATAMAAGKQPELVTQEVTGEAAIVGGDRDKAMREARDAALREAVEQVAGVMITAQSLTANSQLVSDKILSRTEGYVRKYDVLDKKEEAGVMKVTLKVQVGVGQIAKDLQALRALVQQLGSRRLVILLREQTVSVQGTSENSATMATILTEAFSKDGWTIIDPAFAMGKLRLQPGATTLSNVEAQEIGNLAQADYILYGTVVYRQQPPMDKGFLPEKDRHGNQLLFFVTGEYNLALFATDSGSQIAKVAGTFESGARDLGSSGRTGVSYERTAQEITRNRGLRIVEEVRAPVAEYLRNAMMNGNRVVVRVVGLRDYAAAQGFRKVLEQTVSGVREMGDVSFSGGKATFDVLLLGTAGSMAQAVGGKTYKGKKVSVTGVTGNTIEMTLAR
jgi:hypothetical protein